MEEEGLLQAYILDGQGGGKLLNWDDIKQWQPTDGVLWLHFDYSAAKTQEWILNESNLDRVVAEALLAEETRPRTTSFDNALLVALRGVNLNPSSEPEDMVAIRVFLEEHRIITTRKRPILSVSDIAGTITQKKGPRNAADFIVDLTEKLISRMESTIENVEDRVAAVEEEILAKESFELRNELSSIRREAIMLRRYLAPQKEAMIRLHTEKITWFTETDRMRLREVTDQLIRYIEDLDSVRDRAAVTQEELVNRLSEQMNMRMYVLSLVAAIFLPLGFLTGLLGINVGGIPGADNNAAFMFFILMLIAVVVTQIVLFKKKKWM